MGAPTISAEQFAKILLRHTNHDVHEVVERLRNHPCPPTKVCASCTVIFSTVLCELHSVFDLC